MYLLLAAWALAAVHSGFLRLWRVGTTLCCLVQASHWGDCFGCGAQSLEQQASVAVVHGLSDLAALWDPPGPGIKPMSSSLAGGFITTGPPGRSQASFLNDWDNKAVSFPRVQPQISVCSLLFSCANQIFPHYIILYKPSFKPYFDFEGVLRSVMFNLVHCSVVKWSCKLFWHFMG